MRLTNIEWLKELVATHEPPCVSIYLPMLRANPPAAENSRLFREQVDQVRASLSRVYPTRDVRALLEKIESATADGSFWTGNRDGVAVFASADVLRVVDLYQRIEASVHVADHFHIKPLIRLLQSALNYHVLTFTQRKVEVLLGTGGAHLIPLDSHNLPQTPDVVSKMRMSSEISANADLQTSDSQYPGEGTAPAPVTIETFIRAVDKAVWENFSRGAKLPVILCAVEHYHAQFRDISKNTYLLESGIKLDPAHVGVERIKQEAWAIMEPRFRGDVEKLKDHFMAAKAHQRGSDELARVLEAAAVGRVDTLLVDGSRQIPGRLDRDTGHFAPADSEDPRANDVLDDLAEIVLQADGEVLVLPPEMMPGGANLAAIYRY